MNERERQINHRLRSLNNAYRMGRVSRAQYRAQRRQLLQFRDPSAEDTVRNTLATSTSAHERAGTARVAGDDVLRSMFPARIGTVVRYLIVFVAVAAIFGLLLYAFVSRG